jgi:hypothetical protein
MVHMSPRKVKVIREWLIPEKKKDVQVFLGFTNFYRQFIRNFRKITKPLHRLTGNTEWKWGKEQQEAFDGLKTAFKEQVMLAIPDDEGKFWVECDTSDYVLGTVLSQRERMENGDQWIL